MSDDSSAGTLAVIVLLAGFGAYSCHESKKHNDQIDRIEAQAEEANDRLSTIETKLNIGD